MVLFTMEHIAGLYQILTLRFLRHKNETAVLLVNEAYRKFSFLQKMQGRIFADIIFYKVKFRKSDLQEKTWEEQVYKDYNEIFNASSYNIKEFSAIYCFHDIFCDFLYYCAMNDVAVEYMELARGHLSNENLYTIYTNFFHGDPEHEAFSRKYDTILGVSSKYVKKRYVFTRKIEKDTQLNMIEEFYKIDEIDRGILADTIDIGNIRIDENASLFLLNSSGWTVPKTHTDVYAVHAIICDVYLRNIKNLFLKDHPGNVCVRDSSKAVKFFNDIDSLPPEVPLELIVLSAGCTFEKVISCASTSNEKVANYVKQNIVLGNEPYLYWRDLLKLMVTYELEKYIGERYREHFHGVSKVFLLNYRKTIGFPFEEGFPKGINTSILRGKIFTVIDNIENKDETHIEHALEHTDNETIVVFWNSDGTYRFVPSNEALLDNFLVIKISKTALKDNIYPEMKDELLYVYVKDHNIKDKLKKYVYERDLKYSKCHIRVEVMRDSKVLELPNERKRRIKAESELARLRKDLQEVTKELSFERNDTKRILLEEISERMRKAEWRERFYHEVQCFTDGKMAFVEGDEGYPYLCAVLNALHGNTAKNILEFGCSESTKLTGIHATKNDGKHKVLEYCERGWAEFFVNKNRSCLSHTVIYGGTLFQKTLDGEQCYSYSAVTNLDKNDRYGIILLKYPRGRHDAPVTNVLKLIPACLEDEFIILMSFTDRPSDHKILASMEASLKEFGLAYAKIFCKTSMAEDVCIICSEGNRYRFEK